MSRGVAWMCVLVVTGCFSKPSRPAHGVTDADSTDSADAIGIGDSSLAHDSPISSFHNLMFVSQGTFTQPWTIVAMDQFCSTSAHNAGLLGSYVGWMSSPSGTIADRLRNLPLARGWNRPDGLPFADTVNDIITGNILNPPRIDENKQDAVTADPNVQVATGTRPDGTAEPAYDASCGLGIEIGKPANTPAGSWTEAGHVNCSAVNLRLYCFSFGAS